MEALLLAAAGILGVGVVLFALRSRGTRRSRSVIVYDRRRIEVTGDSRDPTVIAKTIERLQQGERQRQQAEQAAAEERSRVEVPEPQPSEPPSAGAEPPPEASRRWDGNFRIDPGTVDHGGRAMATGRSHRRGDIPKAQPAHRESRFANVRFTTPDGRHVPSTRPVEESSVLLLRLAIGGVDPRSLVAKPVAFPLVSDAVLTLRVLVASTDFVFAERPEDLEAGVQALELPLVLPPTGPSRTINGEPELVVATKAPARAGNARIRICYYYRDAVVQSQVVTATVGGTAGGIQAQVDYTASDTFADLDKIAVRPRVSVVTNESGGLHTVLVRKAGTAGDPTTARPTSVPHTPLGEVVKDLRSQLTLRGSTKVARSRRDLEEDLRTLAPLGRRLYRHLFLDVKDILPLHAGPRPIVSITRPRYVRFSLPWNYLYEIGIPEAHSERTPVCPLVTEWDERSPLVPEPMDECPRSKDVPHVEGLLCPFGFWGFRQPLEAPPSVAFADATVVVPRGASIAIGETNKGVNKGDLDAHIARLERLFSDRFATGLSARHTKVAGLRKTLEADLPIVYFLCHGHKEPGKTDTWLGLGDGEFFSSDDFVDWVSAGRMQDRVIWDKVRPLIVINACHSVDISPETLVGYVDAFSAGANAKGVIGTEVRVPVPFAMTWAEAFFGALVKDGADALTALARARWTFLSQGNLFGLVYTPYCWGHLRLTGDEAA